MLGRQDSNLGMAESKSDNLLSDINAGSEKIVEFSVNGINRLATDSECPSPLREWLAEHNFGLDATHR
jgi:hypothetical protein